MSAFKRDKSCVVLAIIRMDTCNKQLIMTKLKHFVQPLLVFLETMCRWLSVPVCVLHVKALSFGEILIVVKQSAQRHLRVRARLKCKQFSDTDWYPNHRTVTCQVRAARANLTGRVRARVRMRAHVRD